MDIIVGSKIVESFTNIDVQISVFDMILTFVIAIITAYIAFQCNLNINKGQRILITILAFIFSTFYLVYYFIFKLLLGFPCQGKSFF